MTHANTFGKLFSVTTFGESHGQAIGCIIDGCPPGLAISRDEIQIDLDRRKPGQSSFVTQRKEPDTVEILSGTYEGMTTGTPIGLIIYNQDARSHDYRSIQDVFRPGHADFTYWQKYGLRDPRGGGRSSARETAMRVAAAAIARKWLAHTYGIEVGAYLAQLGPIEVPCTNVEYKEKNPFFAPDPDSIEALTAFMNQLRREKDSVGAKVVAYANGVPPGWGDPVFDRLDALLSFGLMSIPAAKGVAFGEGFDVVTQKGSYHGDELLPNGFASNHAGGVLGGISTGQPLKMEIAFKPTSSIPRPRRSLNQRGDAIEIATTGRHDPCVGIRAVPVVESMILLTLMDVALRDRAQCANVNRARIFQN